MRTLSDLRLPLVFIVASVLTACSESPTANQDPVPSTIVLSVANASFGALGDTLRVTAIVRDQSGETMTGVPVSWVTSSGSVASVSTTGLVTATGNGSATITGSAGNVSGRVAVAVAQIAERLRFFPDPVTLENVDDTVSVVATIVDANDNPMPSQPVTWSSNAPDTVEVSQGGLVRAIAEGQTFLTATSGGVSGELAAFVGDAVVVIGSVNPSPMIVGAEAVVRGLGFSPVAGENAVHLDGVAAQVVSASSVELRIVVPEADCRPPREGEVTVAARGMVDTTAAAVRPEFLDSFAVGEGAYVTEGCIHLDAGNSTERYLVGVLSSSETPSSLTPARLAARTGSRLLAAGPTRSTPLRTVDGARVGAGTTTGGRFSAPVGSRTGSPSLAAPARTGVALDLDRLMASRLDRSGEAAIREGERRWLESLGANSSPLLADARGGPLRAPPAQGDTLDLNVPGTSCSDGTPVRAVARRVGQSAVFLEDVANPVVPAFTQAQYDALDAELTAVTLPVLTAYFGEFADVDDNDRVLILLTKEVNERENLAGFVFSGDLFPAVPSSEGGCPDSNEAEIFYGLTPDTAGVHGTVRTRESLRLVYPPLIAHELTHILQFTTFIREGVSVKSRWELEGGATLAEQFVGYVALGHGPRQNLGYLEWREGEDPDWYYDWVVDMALYFGFKGQEDPPATNAPEQCSWIGTPDQGNTGPCENNRAVYGVPSTLLRFVLDHYGPQYPGGETALMRQLTSSPYRDLQVLEQVTGEDKVSLLVSFAAMMWADGRAGLGDWLLSWDVFDIFSQVNENARLRPYDQTGATPELDVEVRAASSAYLLWTPPELHDPTSLRIRTLDGQPLPDRMILWVLRIQ